jgi:hypothetical protein
MKNEKKHRYKRVINIYKTLINTIVFKHEFAKSYSKLIFNENRIHHMKTKTRNAKHICDIILIDSS